MPESAKSVKEIEDVLASIRRLVSDSDAAAPPASKLVLTPEFRVTEPDDPWAPVPAAEEEPAPVIGAVAATDEGPSWDPEDRLLDWSEIEDSATQVVAENPADPHPAPVPDAEIEAADLGRPDGALDMAEAEFEPETGDADWPDGSAGSALRELVLARGGTPANPRAPLADAGGDAEGAPKPALILANEGWPGAQPRDPDTSGGVLGKAPEHAAPGEGAQPSTAFTPIFSRRPKMQPDRAGADADDPHPDRGAAGEARPTDHGGSGVTVTGTELPLDEARLRSIIAEVVREELHGATGERIKRYVQRAVRREVGSVLDSDDLD